MYNYRRLLFSSHKSSQSSWSHVLYPNFSWFILPQVQFHSCGKTTMVSREGQTRTWEHFVISSKVKIPLKNERKKNEGDRRRRWRASKRAVEGTQCSLTAREREDEVDRYYDVLSHSQNVPRWLVWQRRDGLIQNEKLKYRVKNRNFYNEART